MWYVVSVEMREKEKGGRWMDQDSWRGWGLLIMNSGVYNMNKNCVPFSFIMPVKLTAM